MKIDVRVTQVGAANWTEDVIEIEKPVEQWRPSDLHTLCGKLQYLIGPGVPVRRCTSVADTGLYAVSVSVDGRKAETITLLPLSAALATDPIWEKQS